MCKKTLFLSLFLEKEVKLGKNQKKAGVGINCGPWPIFPNITHLTHFYIWGVKCSRHISFLLFLGKTGQITRYLEKKTYGHQLGPMTHFFMNHKFDLLSYISIINFLNLPVHALIHDLQKKNLRASTRTHDPFSDNSKIWPTFIYRGEVPADTFAKLPVRALINDPQKNWYRHKLQPMIHFFMNHKFDLLSYISIINFLNLPVHALIHDLQKKTYGHQLGPMTHFLTTPKFDLLLYKGEKCLHTHLQSFLSVP